MANKWGVSCEAADDAHLGVILGALKAVSALNLGFDAIGQKALPKPVAAKASSTNSPAIKRVLANTVNTLAEALKTRENDVVVKAELTELVPDISVSTMSSALLVLRKKHVLRKTGSATTGTYRVLPKVRWTL